MTNDEVYLVVGKKIEELSQEFDRKPSLPYATCLFKNSSGEVFVVEIKPVGGMYVGMPVGFSDPEKG